MKHGEIQLPGALNPAGVEQYYSGHFFIVLIRISQIVYDFIELAKAQCPFALACGSLFNHFVVAFRMGFFPPNFIRDYCCSTTSWLRSVEAFVLPGFPNNYFLIYCHRDQLTNLSLVQYS